MTDFLFNILLSPFNILLAIFARPLIALLLVVAILWLVIRKGWLWPGRRVGDAGAFLPASAPAPSRAARIVEATLLAIAVAPIVVALLVARDLTPWWDHPTIYASMFAGGVACAGAAVVAALLGRTGLGLGIMLVAIVGLLLPAPMVNIILGQYAPKSVVDDITFTLDLAETNVQGAELWVNGVLLGKLPYTTTLSDFEAKVPYWPNPPADYETDNVTTTRYEPRRPWSEVRHRWIEFERGECPLSRSSGRGMPRRDVTSQSIGSPPDGMASHQTPQHVPHPGHYQRARYFVRVRYAGEWCSTAYGGGAFNSDTDGAHCYIESELPGSFPQREERLKQLLNMARVADYRVGPEWFQAAETYSGDAWIALGRAAEEEPRMMQVRDHWAMWHYGLDQVNDAGSAWDRFQQICDEADAEQQYLTDSVAGRAVEMLALKLSPVQLADRAMPLIHYPSTFSCPTWQSHGRLQFGCRRRPGVFAGFPLDGSSLSAEDKTQIPVRAFPMAHALWMIGENLRSAGQPAPNVLQERIAPEILRWHYRDSSRLPMQLALYIGGPDVDKFLLRQNWSAAPDPSRWDDGESVNGQPVNKWLYYLAYLNDRAGRDFRRQHDDLFLAMADQVCKDASIYMMGNINFLFADPWFARQYWPRFARLARQNNSDYHSNYPLRAQWQYLERLGNAADVGMFVEAWRETNLTTMDIDQALYDLDRLKTPMQHQVIEALIRQVREHPQNLRGLTWKPDGPPESVISLLQSHDRSAVRLAEANQLLAELQKAAGGVGPQSLRHNVSLWLAHAQPDSPLVAMLAKADKPELRLMILGALTGHPTPRNQELLKSLLTDRDVMVRAAADKVSQELRTWSGITSRFA